MPDRCCSRFSAERSAASIARAWPSSRISTVPAAGKGFVAQEHPEGRITFIDLVDGQSREITGFELSAKVVNE